MKYLLSLLLVLVQLSAWAQIKGNKEIKTKQFAISQLTSIEMGLYAEVSIDCAAEEMMTITTDENIFDLIETEVENGRLVLAQKEWIQASLPIKIIIGAPNLERIQHSVHETTTVKNINRASFSATAILGQLTLDGQVTDLSVGGELGTVDARAVKSKNVLVNLWDRGKILVGSPEQLTGEVKEDGRVIYDKQPSVLNVKEKGEGRVYSSTAPEATNPEARFIDLKVKNNSLKRINCYVKGPKPDGSTFSYGFPLNPGQARKKHWSVGSKVYQMSKLGTKKLLAVIEAADEDQVVKLFE